MMNEWDAYSVDAATAGRTIFVDNAGVGDDRLRPHPGPARQLFLNGVAAATDFVMEMGAHGHVPRSAAEAGRLVL